MSTVGEFSTLYECELTAGERVTHVTSYLKSLTLGGKCIGGIQLQTTVKTCGPFGDTTSDMETASGHQLLYINGRNGDLVDGLEYVFDYGC